MATPHATIHRLKFAIEFAAIGQAEIEGWLSYFEDMDVNELGAARARRFEVWRRLPCLGWTRGHRTMPGVVSLSSLSCFGPRRGRRGVSRVDGVFTRHCDPTRVYIRTPSTRCHVGPL